MTQVKVRYKFDETFKDMFLGLWFEKSPETYNQAREACDQYGNEMIVWLSETNTDLYRTLYGQTLKETQVEIIDRRLDGE